MVGTDGRSGETFSFEHLAKPLAPGEVEVQGNLISAQGSWRWQRYLAEQIMFNPRTIVGKGRQIGATWVALAVDVEECILKPGTAALFYRQREEDAIDNVRRWFTLFQSLPKHFTSHIKVLKPDRNPQPGESGVELMFPDGRISNIFPMTSAQSSGHGKTVRRITVDEGAHIEMLSEIRAAIEPAAENYPIAVISTAKGRSNIETGEGNEFHRLWVTADSSLYRPIFLSYDVHPDRDQHWYDTSPSVQSLKVRQRNEQYPRNEHEVFRLTAGTYFDEEVLIAYAEKVQQPLHRLKFHPVTSQRGDWRESEEGYLRLYKMPTPSGSYGIAADTASGHGRDSTAAYVIDLATMEFAAEYHRKIDHDIFARDLHFLGKLFNTAEILVEQGDGDVVIVALRDGKSGRRAYPRLYRHPAATRVTLPVSAGYGFPMNVRTRPLVINQLEKALRDGVLPYVTDGLLHEMENFIDEPPGDSPESKKGPWPRAAQGFHDDRVMAAAMALELYRLRGAHEDPRPERKPRKRMKPVYPWLPEKDGHSADSVQHAPAASRRHNASRRRSRSHRPA
jgi:hypothetical protein